MISSERNFLHKMIFNKLRIFGVIFACVFTLHGFADEECENEQYNINNECKYCNAGYCVDNDECVACPAGYKCPETDGNLLCSNVKSKYSNYICPVNTYSDAGKTSCTSCGIGYATGNSGPIVTDSEDNVSGDGLCLKIENESGLGYGCISSRACQMVTPQLCKGGCFCDAESKLLNAMMGSDSDKADAKTALTNCRVTEAVANCLLLGDCDGVSTRPSRPIRKTFIGDDTEDNKQNVITNAFLENKKLVRCFCNTSFGLGNNVTTVKMYSDVVNVVYPDDSASE